MARQDGFVWLGQTAQLVYSLVLLLVLTSNAESQPQKKESNPLIISDSNWTSIMEGEWMVEFMAPWCPACRAFKETWAEFAGWGHDLDISVGVVDVTESPGMSGRFLIASLPTIFHIKDGKVRQYYGARKTNDLISVIDEKKWAKIEPVAWYRDPNSFQMGFIGGCFKTAMFIRGFYNTMVDTYGIPEWACYVIFAVLTIITGLLLGLLIVLFCDNFFPAKYIPLPAERIVHPDKDDTDLIDDTAETSEGAQKESDAKETPPNSQSGDGSGARKRLVNKDGQ